MEMPEIPVAKRPRSELQNSEEIIQEQRRVEKQTTVIENQIARIQRLEEELLRNSESSKEIIQEQRQVIKNQKTVIESQKAQIQQLEEELLRNSESSTTETNIKNVLVPVPELPNEIWLEIMSYLSTFDLLRNVAQVSKKFHKFSEDPHVIRKIGVESVQSWPEDKKEKYCDDFLGVLKRSLKLRSLSFGFSWDIRNDRSGEKFLEALPSMNHHFLQEFCLKGDGKDSYDDAAWFLKMLPDSNPLNENIVKYLEKCPNLKILKFEFKPEVNGTDLALDYPFLDDVHVLSLLKLKNLQELHLIGVFLGTNFGGLSLNSLDPEEVFLDFEELLDFKDYLDTFAQNFPRLQRLCLTCENDQNYQNETFQAFASKRNINVEIAIVKTSFGCSKCAESWMPPVAINEMKIFGPR